MLTSILLLEQEDEETYDNNGQQDNQEPTPADQSNMNIQLIYDYLLKQKLIDKFSEIQTLLEKNSNKCAELEILANMLDDIIPSLKYLDTQTVYILFTDIIETIKKISSDCRNKLSSTTGVMSNEK